MCLVGYMYFIDVQLIYNAVLISAIQQSDWFMYLYTHIHTHTWIFSFILFSMMVYHKILNIVPEGTYIFECCLSMTHLNSSSFNQICFFSHTLKLFWGHYFQWTRVVFSIVPSSLLVQAIFSSSSSFPSQVYGSEISEILQHYG